MQKLTAKFYNSKENNFIEITLLQAPEPIVINYKNKLENLWEEIQNTMEKSTPPYIIQIDDLNKDNKPEYFKIFKYSFDPFETFDISDDSEEFVSILYIKTENALNKLLNMINQNHYKS